ncbi:unnamed protein product [Callosobruchus maculatus]|uniref:Major facilitator superfamily (MFS) profile domain-containing protein n=1 Tax=Callosobruchus maculatus TaxID=64391 RepID=A0A653CIN8_CALMS|nr:unnamed protein product [Callosobruchus maculatus]
MPGFARFHSFSKVPVVHIISDTKPADFETAILASGYGKFNLILYMVSVTAGWSSIFETTTMSYVFPAAECDLELSLSHKGWLNAITYAGMISSAFIWGYLSDTLGRKKLLVIGYLLDALLVTISAFSQNFYVLITTKFLGGLIINGPFAALTSYLSEFHCAKHRARVQMIVGFIFSIGNLLLPILALAIFPLQINLQLGDWVFHSWNVYLLICSLPPLISGVAFVFLPESPKFLMTAGKNDKALKIFRQVYRLNTGKLEETYPITELVDENRSSQNTKDPTGRFGYVTAGRTKKQALREGWKQILPLFCSPYLFKLVMVCAMQFLQMMGLNTLRLWLPQLYQAMNDHQYYSASNKTTLCDMLEVFQKQNETKSTSPCEVNMDNSQVYTNSMIVAGVSIVGYIVAGGLINIVGKKKLLNILGLTSGTVAIAMYYATNIVSTIAMSSVFVALSSIGMHVILTVVVDLFPTTLRTMTVSFTMMFGRIGAGSGNLIFPYLLQSGCGPPFLTIGSVMIGCAILACFVPNTDMKALE